MQQYNHRKIEKKWQKKWEKDDIYTTTDKEGKKENYYFLVEFPYPSGNLHVGHWYAFAVPDIFVRKKRMEGYNVLYPIGFDSFGLPAENAAIKRDLDPREWTYGNIKHMKEQLKSMGNSFDWSREVITSDPEYYTWTQKLFLEFFKKGLAYRKKANVNWCPSCKTVLANEQVIDGICERCQSDVIQKELEQWFFKITDYAERLLEDLEDLSWPEQIKEAQKNWIGKSEGAVITFKIQDSKSIEVFTTRPDTLFGVTYLALSPQHSFLRESQEKIENWEDVEKYIGESKNISENKSKTGIELKGVKAMNPATKEEIPVWISDYVLGDVGTGAIMAVPAHDVRDFEFAKQFKIPIQKVIEGGSGDEDVYTGEGALVNSGEFNGMKSEEAKGKIIAFVSGEKKTTYRLRDWLLSRQRYWGTPIPIVYDPEEKAHPVPEEHLPWTLPRDVDFTPTGESPLARSEELKSRVEKIFGKGWTPEVDTMDTFVDSSWYFLRYIDPKNKKEFSSIEKQKDWMPVNQYSGGAEHTTMHLLYSRFFYKALFDLGLVKEKEPYHVRMNRGLVLGPDGHKMSKSRGNVIDPDENIERVGADTVKMYLAFIGPYNEVGSYPWDLGGIAGIRRFLERVWRLQEKVEDIDSTEDKKIETLFHQTIKKVTDDIEKFKFNTAISALMIFAHELERIDKIPKLYYNTLIQLIGPFAPHFAEELWEIMGNSKSVHLSSWPQYDAIKIREESVEIAVQVNGKLRDTIQIGVDESEQEVIKKSLEQEHVSKWIGDEKIEKTIYVKGRLLNIVTK